MLYPPDDLLTDLQSVVEPNRQSTVSGASYSHLPDLPGTQKQPVPFDVPPGYDAPALSDEENQVSIIVCLYVIDPLNT